VDLLGNNTMRLFEMRARQIIALPLPELAHALLCELHDSGECSQLTWSLRYFSDAICQPGHALPPPAPVGVGERLQVALALSEAWQFLFTQMLLCDDLNRVINNRRSLGFFRITQRGQAVLALGLEALQESDCT
jgi:hypothetical protein